MRDRHNGEFPDAFDDVVALPGIGRSTAGAILSLAFGQRHPILDGNAKRVLARHDAIAGWPGKSAIAKALWQAAERNTPEHRIAAYTQAIMDLGATLCTRSKPSCDECPVNEDCRARLDDTIAGPHPESGAGSGACPKSAKIRWKTGAAAFSMTGPRAGRAGRRYGTASVTSISIFNPS